MQRGLEAWGQTRRIRAACLLYKHVMDYLREEVLGYEVL